MELLGINFRALEEPWKNHAAAAKKTSAYSSDEKQHKQDSHFLINTTVGMAFSWVALGALGDELLCS